MEFTPVTVTLKDHRAVTLRNATPADAPAMHAFMARLRGATPFVVTAPDEAPPVEELAESIKSDLERPGCLVLIAIPTDQPDLVVGDCWLVPFKERKMAHVADIGMGCDTRWHGVGLGSALLGAVVRHAIGHPALARIELGVMPQNAAARRLYGNQGFLEEGRRTKRFKDPEGAYSDEVVMGRRVDSPDSPDSQ
ncbi:MAG: putative acetyltransferase [Phycisphaerales bacterium]|jgi:putative acetyltransferase